jgi:hypothetical protein
MKSRTDTSNSVILKERSSYHGGLLAEYWCRIDVLKDALQPFG